VAMRACITPEAIQRKRPDLRWVMRVSQWLVLGSVVQCLACIHVPANSPIGKSSEKLQRLNQAVFQIVVPRVEDDGVQYKEPLPWDLLPYDQAKRQVCWSGDGFCDFARAS